jgi:hypothetical protein
MFRDMETKERDTHETDTFITLAAVTARVTDQLFKQFDEGVDAEKRRQSEQDDEHGDCEITIEGGRLRVGNKKAANAAVGLPREVDGR